MIDSQTRDSWDDLTLKMRSFVGRRVGDGDADDVVQEVLMRVLRGVNQLRDDERFGPWIYRIAKNVVVDHLRARARTPGGLDAPPPSDSGDDELHDGLLGCLAGFIASLPAQYREPLVLTELQGLTQAEASVMLGLSLSGAKSRVQRGRRRLRAKFEQACQLSQDRRGRVSTCIPRDSEGSCESSETRCEVPGTVRRRRSGSNL